MKIPVFDRFGKEVTRVDAIKYRNIRAINIEAVHADDDVKGAKKISGTFIFEEPPKDAYPYMGRFIEVDTKSFLCHGDGELFELP